MPPLNIFNTFGYLSIIFWLIMLILWMLHVVRKPRRWFCHLALVAGGLALVFGEINSKTHINRLQIDRSEQIAEAQARQEARRQAAEAERADDVAQIRYAEDDADDYLDMAGMDEADRKYIESFDETETPAWKKQKRTRSTTAEQDDSLDGLTDPGSPEREGMDVSAIEEEAPPEPIVMSEANVMLARRLDDINLLIIGWLLVLGTAFVLYDYVRRLNIYEEAYLPLPLPGRLVNGVTRPPVIWRRPAEPRRTMQEELEWFTRSGDAFVYLTDDPAVAARIPEKMARLPFGGKPVEVLRGDGEALPLDDAFVFEALWYNRASFVIASGERGEQFLERAVEELRNRRKTRASVDRTVHIVWDLARPVPEPLRGELADLAGAAGWSVLVNNSRQPSLSP